MTNLRQFKNLEYQLNNANSFDPESPYFGQSFTTADNAFYSSLIYDKQGNFGFAIGRFPFLIEIFHMYNI